MGAREDVDARMRRGHPIHAAMAGSSRRILSETPSRKRVGVAMHDADARIADLRHEVHRQCAEACGIAATTRRSRQNLVRARHDALVDALRIGAAAARADVARARDLGLDVAAQAMMPRDAALDFGEPVRLGVEPMVVAVEHDRDRTALARGETLDLAERREISIEPADDVEDAWR